MGFIQKLGRMGRTPTTFLMSLMIIVVIFLAASISYAILNNLRTSVNTGRNEVRARTYKNSRQNLEIIQITKENRALLLQIRRERTLP